MMMNDDVRERLRGVAVGAAIGDAARSVTEVATRNSHIRSTTPGERSTSHPTSAGGWGAVTSTRDSASTTRPSCGVSTSIPSSMVPTGQMWNWPAFTASMTSSLSIRFWTLLCGMITPCWPVNPFTLQMAKKPSIFSFTPPMACTWPNWFTEPVTAKRCWMGRPESEERSA